MEWFAALQGIHIVLIVGILLLLAGYIYLVVKVTRLEFVGGLVGKCAIRVFGILFGSIVVVYLLYNLHNIQPNQWVEISLLAGLVGATGFLALVTLQQAHTTAKEMKEQRLGEARPYLLLRLKVEKDELLQWDDYKSSKHPTEFPVTIRNAGKGPAINLEAALWHPKTTYLGESKGFLAPGEEWQTTISSISDPLSKEGWLPQLKKSIKQEYAGVVAVKYSDIYHRVWVSYLCLERHTDIEAFVMEGEQNIVELKNHD